VPHVHVHQPHELDESGGPPSRRERVLELAAVLLLSITAVATAWCGYQAARWSGEQSQHYARASVTRIYAAARPAARPARLAVRMTMLTAATHAGNTSTSAAM
jgi:hypothetical protein